MNFDVLAGCLAAVPTSLLAWRWRACWTAWTTAERAAAVLAVPGLFLLALILIKTPLRMLEVDLNAARLAPSVAMTYGYPVYGRPDQDPILCTIYGPVTFLAYLPAALCSTPVGAILAGGIITLILLFLPLGVVFHAVGRSIPISAAVLLLGFLTTVAFLSLNEGTSYWYDHIHADAPTLGLGLLACAFLIPSGEGPPSTRRLAASALCAVLAVLAKQTSIAVPVALALTVAWTSGRRQAGIYGAVAAAGGLVLGLSACLAFGFREFWFNAITIPSRHPWQEAQGSGLRALAVGILPLLEHSVIALIVFGGALIWAAEVQAHSQPWRARLAREPWLPFVVVGVCMWPTSLLGMIKVGGTENSDHARLYFSLAAVLLLLRSFTPLQRRLPRSLQALSLGLGAAVLVLALQLEWHQAGRTPPDVIRENPQQRAFEFVRDHPRQVWLAGNPLVTLYADGKLYHFDYAVYDRDLAGFPPTDRHLREHLPERLTYASRAKDFPLARTLLRDFTWRSDLGYFRRATP